VGVLQHRGHPHAAHLAQVVIAMPPSQPMPVTVHRHLQPLLLNGAVPHRTCHYTVDVPRQFRSDALADLVTEYVEGRMVRVSWTGNLVAVTAAITAPAVQYCMSGWFSF
jgi:hypothetical protein